MRRDGSTGQEEWFACRMCLTYVVDSLLGQIVSVVCSLVANRGLGVPLPSGVPVAIRERVQEEVRRSPSCRVRVIIVIDGMRIE